MVNLVTIGDIKYHVDVGFGGNGPVVPMKLDKAGEVQEHIFPATARLQWRNIPGNTDPNQRLWVYEHKIDNNSDFQPIYCFTELEFLPSDYAIMNYFTSTSPRTFFTRVIVAEKKIVGEDGETLVGSLIMGNSDLKWRVRGQKDREIKFECEEDRIKALADHFGIELSLVEKEGIRGLPSELK
jgi:arylamine N-acetyltransferase